MDVSYIDPGSETAEVSCVDPGSETVEVSRAETLASGCLLFCNTGF